jgi:hypothetical protein
MAANGKSCCLAASSRFILLIVFRLTSTISAVESLHAFLLLPSLLFCGYNSLLLFLLVVDDRVHSSCGAEEVGVVGVDVCSLYRDERLDIVRARTQSLSKQVRDNFDQLRL